ncbi:PP2C family protein-serine/threonine phosphatase [Actinomadura kijaniata]
MGVDGLRLEELLAAAERAAPMESVDVVAANLRRRFDAGRVSFLFADLVGQQLVRLTAQDRERNDDDVERIRLAGSVYDEVLRDQRPLHDSRAEDGHRVIAPVTNRGDCIGLLELTLPHVDDHVLDQVAEAAHTLAYVIVTDRRFTDLYHWGRRTTPVSLAAEIQHRLLPSASCCEASQFALAGALVPADDIGGDTYDYTLDSRTLHVSITDAMGHDVDSALLATLLVGALRCARREGRGIVEQAVEAHRALADNGREGFATGQLLRVDLESGSCQVVNAGHPWPILLRDGRAERLALEVDLPFGMPVAMPYRAQRLDLRPGDRLLLLTDGALERGAASLDVFELLCKTRDLHVREAVRALTAAVDDACGGHLQDDATVLCLDWHGTAAARRQADEGSSGP